MYTKAAYPGRVIENKGPWHDLEGLHDVVNDADTILMGKGMKPEYTPAALTAFHDENGGRAEKLQADFEAVAMKYCELREGDVPAFASPLKKGPRSSRRAAGMDLGPEEEAVAMQVKAKRTKLKTLLGRVKDHFETLEASRKDLYRKIYITPRQDAEDEGEEKAGSSKGNSKPHWKTVLAQGKRAMEQLPNLERENKRLKKANADLKAQQGSEESQETRVHRLHMETELAEKDTKVAELTAEVKGLGTLIQKLTTDLTNARSDLTAVREKLNESRVACANAEGQLTGLKLSLANPSRSPHSMTPSAP
jgi:hypothetical protein